MRALIRAEFLKLTTIRLPYVLAAAAALLTAFVTVLTGFRAGGSGRMSPPPLDTAAGLSAVTGATSFGLMLALVLGVMIASGEYRHGTATSTYLATPRRVRVLLAKAAVAACAGVLLGLVAAAVATGVGLIFVAAKGLPVVIPASTIVKNAGGAALGAALLAVVGACVGSLIRQQVGAIVAVLAWALALEHIVGALVPSISPYLPFTAATTLAGASLAEGTSALPFGAAAALLVAVAGAFGLVAWRTALPRDVS